MLNRMLFWITIPLFAAVFAAQAGPPLICHPNNIGTAVSLPWGNSETAGWDNPDPSYNTRQLSADTLKILDAGAPVLVRMETLRRATIYGEKDHAAARDLLSNLKSRASVQPAALALFDYGYFVESIKQMQWRYKDDLTGRVDGSVYVNRAVARMPESADMRSAADRINGGKKT